MGNRAIIAFEGQTTGIYLHWNGGPESVYAFLDYADKHVGAARGWDDDYCVARLIQIIGNFFGGVHSLGVAYIEDGDILKASDNYGCDNGCYLVGPADHNAKRGYRIAARCDRTRLLSDDEITREEWSARKHHAYWKDGSMLADIATKNDQFFVEKARV